MTSGSGTRRRITPVTGLECDVRPNQTDSTIASGSTTAGQQPAAGIFPTPRQGRARPWDANASNPISSRGGRLSYRLVI